MAQSQSASSSSSKSEARGIQVRSKRSRPSDEPASSVIVDHDANASTLDEERPSKAIKVEDSSGVTLKIRIPARATRKAAKSKGQRPKQPPTVNGEAGPTFSSCLTFTTRELKRRDILLEDETCQLATNSKYIVYCRACEDDYQLEWKKNAGGYYLQAWAKHANTPGHIKCTKEWKARGGDKISKENDAQWEAVKGDLGKRLRSGLFKRDLVLRKVEVKVDPKVTTTAEKTGCSEEAKVESLAKEADAALAPKSLNADENNVQELRSKTLTPAEDGATATQSSDATKGYTKVELMVAQELLNLRYHVVVHA
ncbi:hypothetical protein MD484_g4888, partial [Candolleomyces efflorescens]